MEELFSTLERAGIERSDLYLAWDFTVASERSLSERMLPHPRRRLRPARRHEPGRPQGRRAPRRQFTARRAGRRRPRHDGSTAGATTAIARRVEGTVTVPCYLDQPGCPPGSQLHARPGRRCRAHPRQRRQRPTSSASSRARVAAGPRRRGRRSTATACSAAPARSPAATSRRWPTSTTSSSARPTGPGMSTRDVPNAVAILRTCRTSRRSPTGPAGDPQLPVPRPADDPPARLRRDPAFQDDGQPVIDTARLFYDGNSQGGIIGGALDRGRARLQPRRCSACRA